MKSIPWLSMPRSGSNFLSDHLHGFENVASFREIFQPKGVHLYNSNATHLSIMEFIGAKTGLSAGVRSNSLISFARNNPNELIDIIHEHFDSVVISFKIFPGHLSQSKLEEVLSRDGSIPIVLWRNPLDAFVSRVKAHRTGLNVGVDTTNEVVGIDVKSYAAHLEARSKWTEEINRIGGVAGILKYEDFVLDAKQNLAATAQLLRSLDLPVGRYHPPERVTARQDRNEKIQDKIANFTGFVAECEKARLPLDSDFAQFKITPP